MRLRRLYITRTLASYLPSSQCVRPSVKEKVVCASCSSMARAFLLCAKAGVHVLESTTNNFPVSADQHLKARKRGLP